MGFIKTLFIIFFLRQGLCSLSVPCLSHELPIKKFDKKAEISISFYRNKKTRI